jgi:hypothetical protein
MNELRESFGEKGLRILAISTEPASRIEPFIAEKGITYPVGLSTDVLGIYGGGGIPHAYLIGPDGVVLWEGHPSSLQKEQIEQAVRLTFSLRKVAPELKQAAAAFEKGKLAEARTLALAAKAKGGRLVEEDADYIAARVDEIVAAWKQAAEKADCIDAIDALARIQKHLPGTEDAKAAAAKEKEIRADPAAQTELAAWAKLEKIRADLERAEGDPKKLKPIRKKLEKLIETDGATKAAKSAQQLLDALRK